MELPQSNYRDGRLKECDELNDLFEKESSGTLTSWLNLEKLYHDHIQSQDDP